MPSINDLERIVNIVAIEKKLGECPRHRFTPLRAKLIVDHGGATPLAAPSVTLSIVCEVEGCPASRALSKRLFSWVDKDPSMAMGNMIESLIREYRESEFKRVFE